MSGSVDLFVNATRVRVPDEPPRSLLHVLREELGLTAAKYGCGEGACGACTVVLDGAAIRSCTTMLADAAGGGHAVTTLEGLRDDALTIRLQEGFLHAAAMQCGYCTPGMIVAARAASGHDVPRDEAGWAARLGGNVCRCGTYPRILRALELAGGTRASTASAGSTAAAGSTASPEALALHRGIEAAPRPKRPWDLSRPEDREYFDVLGDGLVVVVTPEDTDRIGPEPAWSTEGGAWLHIAPDGQVTAFTGKVDVGQDNRTALSAIVADELGVPVQTVDLVMGDTDLCPYDIGTFGSRSTTDAGRVLALCARAARERIGGPADTAQRGLAWARLEGERTVVSAGVGATRGAAGVEPTAPGRVRARDMVTGERRYGSDLALPGMLHGGVLRPPAMGARLRSLDTGPAERMEGVRVVRDGDFVGVVADDPLRASSARDAIQATWDVPPQPSDAAVVEYLRSHPIALEGWEGEVFEERGDVEAGLAGAAVRSDATYTTAFLAHVPLETRCAVAHWDDGRLTVWVGTQRPFGVREQLAEELGVPEEDVRVVVPPTGSGYGGKHGSDVALEAARLARGAGAPVKVRWSRAEEFSWAYFRPAAVIDIRAGVERDGALVAWDHRNVNSGSQALDTPYAVAARRVAFQPADSPLAQGSYRALSATANCFARESHMDDLAAAIGCDPLEFRLRNLRDERLAAVFRAATERAGWYTSREAGRFLGLAGGIEKGARIAAVVELREVDRRPRLVRIVEAVDCGRIIDPDNLINQVEGAIVMGLGGALFEAIHFADGTILNGSMSAYRVPRFGDVPPIEVVLLDQPDTPSAGAGETPIIAVAPAIANAWFAATGERRRSLPLFPDAWR